MVFEDYQKKLSPSHFQDTLRAKIKRSLAFSPDLDFEIWRNELEKKFKELVGHIYKDEGIVQTKVLYEEKTDEYTLQKIIFPTVSEAMNSGYLLIPSGERKTYPAMVCLQGHSPGAHLSVGIHNTEQDKESLGGDRDFAIQAIRNGYVALAIEQRCFGEREEKLHEKTLNNRCWDASMEAILLGHTIIAERMADIMRGIDLLCQLPFVDKDRIGCMGNSTGGTMTYYTACVDKRIAVSVPSCSFCSLETANTGGHCMCGYIPGALRYFDIPDLAGLIAPRDMIIVSGEEDPLVPASQMEKEFEKARLIYEKAGAAEKLKFIVGSEGHRFYASLTWPEINRAFQNL